MAKKKKDDKPEPQSVLYYFYTQERLDNWMKTLMELDFEGDPESDEMPEGLASLDNFTKDLNVSVLKIVKIFQNNGFDSKTALDKMNEVEEIIMGEVPENELTDILQGVQMRFLVLFLSCRKYINGEIPSAEIKDLVKSGRDVGDEDPEKALEIAADIGALVLDGGSCCGKYLRGDVDEPIMFDDWLIEVDDMGEAMKTLSKFDEEFGVGI
ncbi:conserved hypothetical protein [Methanolacinia petrolearia DSM 11571]|uniref:DUF2150 domain-containing protein n=1 Tax=Methanolacinia petrolearia (strain DSM 11571 / OCM 486 / SEBR 4847) TaxID=679926 RepID=E1RK70_METP4|nr:DUF2150 family protein [Methanolacinia petrolearia]ADN35793.1 conserved hypothetical protein [Methanolacinia petrolearia DSM 11571]